MAGGWPFFALLFLVFVLTWAATRFGRGRKLARGLAEAAGGRNAAQVVANVGLAAWAIPVALLWPDFALAATWALVAVLAEAAADTCSSELGKAYGGKTVLLTTGRAVPPGTDGGVSWLGTAAALFASLSIASSALGLRALSSGKAVAALTLAGILGALLDSVLGATLERNRRLNNDAVNLLGTLIAALLAAGFCFALLRLR